MPMLTRFSSFPIPYANLSFGLRLTRRTVIKAASTETKSAPSLKKSLRIVSEFENQVFKGATSSLNASINAYKLTLRSILH
jgi:hypothetical protein